MPENDPKSTSLGTLLVSGLLALAISAAAWALTIGPALTSAAELRLSAARAEGKRERDARFLKAGPARANESRDLSAELERYEGQLLPGGDAYREMVSIMPAFTKKFRVVLEDATPRPIIRGRLLALPDSHYQSVSFGVKLSGSDSGLREFLAGFEKAFPYAFWEKATLKPPQAGQRDWTLDARLLFVQRKQSTK